MQREELKQSARSNYTTWTTFQVLHFGIGCIQLSRRINTPRTELAFAQAE